MNRVMGEQIYTSTNGDGAELLGVLAAMVEDMNRLGMQLGVEVRLVPASLLETQARVIHNNGATAHSNGATVLSVDPTPAAPGPVPPARDPDEPQEEWDLRPAQEAVTGRRMPWDWSLLRDPELRPTVVGLDRGQATWRQVTKEVRHQILEFFAAHLVKELGSAHVPYKLWDARRPGWMPMATAAPVAYRMPWAALMQNGARCVPGMGAPSGG